jgi:transposase
MSEPCQETTARGERCRNVALAGSDRCAQHTRASARGGRPTKLDEELTEQFVSMLRAGNYIGVAARAVGIGRRTFGDWMERGRSEREADAPYREFRMRVEQARAEGEVRNVVQIATAARENWQAAAWILERSYPERWGRPSAPQRRESTTDEAELATSADPDPFAEVDELAEKRRARSR